MSASLPDLAEALLSAATRAGAEAADAVVTESRTVSVDVLDGALEQAERAEGRELGLRVLIGRRQACVAASDLRPDTIAEMAERAVAMARLAPEDPTAGLAEASELARDTDAAPLELFDPTEPPSPAELEATALEAEAAALAVPGVSKVDGAGAGYQIRRLWLAGTNGFSGGFSRSSHGRSVAAITGTGLGMEKDYYGETRTHFADLPAAEEIGRTAGERAAARAGATRPPTGAWPVLYDERVASGLIGHLAAAVTGTAIARGASWLRDAMGEEVLPKGLSLTEDPRRLRTAASRPFDLEGLPSARRDIVADGVLQGWILDLATARKLGLQSTANAVRGSGTPPRPAPGNLHLTPGTATREELLAEMGTGLLVTSYIGASINPNTGDYSRGASGFWVENGEITRPVNECTIAGNLREMLRTIRPANDARPYKSHVVPSLLVEGLTIAGA